MLTWLVRGCVISAGVMLLAVGFWQTGQWSWCNRLFVAFVRMMFCVVVVLVGIAAGPPVLQSVLQASSHATAVLRLVVVLPSRESGASATRSESTSDVGRHPVAQPSVPVSPSSPSSVAPTTGGGMSVLGGPTLSAAFVDAVLAAHHSPAVGTGQVLYELSKQYGIDDAFALAFFWHESNFGVNGEAAMTHSLGNLRCLDGATCIDSDRGGYAAFPDWVTGFAAWYALIAGPLYVGDGLTTVQAIIPRYAPTADHNDETAYIANMTAVVVQLRAGQVAVG